MLKLVAERGADAVSTQQIEDLIGFTQAAVFRHFPSKEDIWSAALAWLDNQLEAFRASARATAPDQGIGVLQRIFFGHIGLIERHPVWPKLSCQTTSASNSRISTGGLPPCITSTKWKSEKRLAPLSKPRKSHIGSTKGRR